MEPVSAINMLTWIFMEENKSVLEAPEDEDPVTGFEALYISMLKCKRTVSWKPAVKSFTLNGLEKCLGMAEHFERGTWKHGEPRLITITCPKRREGLSVPFRDRIYQRSLNDNVLYPKMTKSFILDNAACQGGKGPDFARTRLRKFLWNFYCHHGLDGYVLQIDIHGYYPTMRHDIVKEKFSKHLRPEELEAAMSVLSHQYSGEVGFNPGSQMVQIAGISVLDSVDHYIKEQLHARYYIRYMDDFWILSHDLEDLKNDLGEITEKIRELGFQIHESKTQITPLRNGFTFLGFRYRMTETGKVIMTINSDSVRRERRKLVRMVAMAKAGGISRTKVDECYRDWKEFVSRGNSHNLIKRMDAYYKGLWR